MDSDMRRVEGGDGTSVALGKSTHVETNMRYSENLICPVRAPENKKLRIVQKRTGKDSEIQRVETTRIVPFTRFLFADCYSN